jgi:hypothetical protein
MNVVGAAPTAPRLENHSGTSSQLIELLTVAEVAALLKVGKSWVYEHAHLRNLPHSDRSLTSMLASTCGSSRTSFAGFWIGKRFADVRTPRSK